MTAYQLHDRFRLVLWLRFLLFFLAFFVPAFWGMKVSGVSALTCAWLVLSALFFGFWLPAILCRHCPHYARPGRFIVCPSVVGALKLRRYCPEPVSAFEKVQFAVGFVFVLGFPFPVLLFHRQFLFAGLALLGALVFVGGEQRFSCSRCLNFSCLLNRVPEDTRAACRESNHPSST